MSDTARTAPKKNAPSERVYDFLYDPIYTVSSEVDHARTTIKAFTTNQQIRKVTEFESMFSILPHHPRYTVHLEPTYPVPAFIDRRWRGLKDQYREALQQLAGVIPNSQWKREEYRVTGGNCLKYYQRPLIPFLQQVPQVVIYAAPKEDPGRLTFECLPTHSTVEIQTDYRESEAQTDPYSPEYVVKPGTTPSELLALTSLTWGRGLPAGLAEIEMIERVRAKRAFEATLPPLDDLGQLDKRRRMMEEMEAEEWALREKEIQMLQEARLTVLKQRDEALKDVTHERLSQTHFKHLQIRETRLQKSHHNYMRSLRKLEAKRRALQGRIDGRGVARKDADVAPKTDACRARRDTHESKSYWDTYEGLLELESGLQSPFLKQKLKKSLKPKAKPAEIQEIRVLKKIKDLIRQAEEVTKPLRYLVKREKVVLRPDTPRVEEPPEGEEEVELAVINLQKFLRGRSVQYKMVNGKEKHADLVHELKTSHGLLREDQDVQRAHEELITTLKNQRDEDGHKAAQEEGFHAKVLGAELENLFDTLSKELIHLQEERRIHAFALLAERDRLQREAEESGRRQIEERRRKEEDEIFRQMVQVHQETVDLYFEDIILETLEQTTDQQAREEIHTMAKKINDIAYAMEEGLDSLQSEEIVSQLVYSFLIPETEKIRVRRAVHQMQHRHLQAARRIIEGTAGDAGSGPDALGACPAERAAAYVLDEVIDQQGGEVDRQEGEVDRQGSEVDRQEEEEDEH